MSDSSNAKKAKKAKRVENKNKKGRDEKKKTNFQNEIQKKLVNQLPGEGIYHCQKAR